MIVYTLNCSQGHSFDEWFSSSADYARRAKAGTLSCPDCGDKKVAKGMMAPNVATGSAAPAPACGAQSCGNTGCPMSGTGR